MVRNKKRRVRCRRLVSVLATAAFAGVCGPSGRADTIYWGAIGSTYGSINSTDTASGITSTVITGTGVGSGGNNIVLPGAIAVGPDGDIYVGSAYDYGAIVKVTPAGVPTLVNPEYGITSGLCFDSSGNLYVSEFNFGDIEKITPGGTVTTFAQGVIHPSAGPGSFDPAGNLYVSGSVSQNSTSNSIIAKITPSGAVSTFATSTATVYWDSSGDLYTETLSGTITLTTPSGSVSTLATGLNAYMLGPDGRGDIYLFHATNGSSSELEMLSPDGTISEVAALPNASAYPVIVPEPSALLILLPLAYSLGRRWGRNKLRDGEVTYRQRPSCQT